MRFVPLVLVLLLTACQTAYTKDGQPNENSTAFRVPVDSKFVLEKQVTFPPYQRTMFFQNGQILDFANVNRWIAYCAITVHAQRQVPQTVKPDTFVVQKVSEQFLFQLASAPVQVAQLDRGGFQQWRVLATVHELYSDRQPDVVRLTCAEWGLPQDISNVTVRGIRKSLGDVVTLRLADLNKPSVSAPTGRRRPEGSGY